MNDLEIIKDDSPVSIEMMERWYHNIAAEMQMGLLPPAEVEYFAEYYREAGLLRSWRLPFFMRHYAEPFSAAANYLMGGESTRKKVILDLGCGCGTQSIAFALMGAKVIGLDMDRRALDILLQRKKIYEKASGRSLDIEVHDGDVFAFDYSAVGPIDGIYSMFAFNMMQPTKKLLGQLLPQVAPGGRFVIQDGNRLSWLARVPGRQRQVLAPDELGAELISQGFLPSWLRGTISLPPIVWSILPRQPLTRLDEAMNKQWFWPISYMAMYEKQGAAPAT